jgi:hypothetical protein
MLHDCRAAALEFHAHVKDDARYIAAFPPELDIVVWALRAKTAAESSARAQEIFEKSEKAACTSRWRSCPQFSSAIPGIQVARSRHCARF